GKEMAEIRHVGAYIESTALSHQFTFTGKVQKTIRNNQPVVDMNIDSQLWVAIQ
ncbi:hypothetical protein HKBW3S34_02511, partial [Candidatus Hakubella thermalkaliphila]